MSAETAETAEPTEPAADAGEAASRKREQRGWYFYDFACSVYSTSVLTVFIGPYLTSTAKAAADADGFVHPLGIPVRAGSLFAYAVSVSVVVAVILMPIVGAAADRTGRKKPLLAAAAYTGAVATAGMFFLDGDRYLLGAFLLIVANAAISVSMVLYNAYLPQIAGPEERDAVSSRGWAFGYTSGAFVLILNLVLYTGHDSFGLSESDSVRICLASAGLWWGAFTIVPLRRLRDRNVAPDGEGAVGSGWRQLMATLRDMRRHPLTLSFLLAYLIYNDGVQTVISQASVYGSEELDLDQTTLITAVLLVQILAVAGALGMVAGPGVRREAHDPRFARRLDADPRRRIFPALRGAGLLLCAGVGDRPGAGRQPGAVALALLPSGAARQGGRVLLRVRDERPRTELAGAAGVRARVSADRQLPGCDHLVGDLLRGRFRTAREGAGAAGRGGRGQSRSGTDLDVEVKGR